MSQKGRAESGSPTLGPKGTIRPFLGRKLDSEKSTSRQINRPFRSTSKWNLTPIGNRREWFLKIEAGGQFDDDLVGVLDVPISFLSLPSQYPN